MREIRAGQITQAVRDLCIRANKVLPCDIEARLAGAAERETSPLAKEILGDLMENCRVAREMDIPICQDTGMAVVFVRLGQEVHITGGLLTEAVNRGVSLGYTEGLLRCSVAGDPLRRVNTGDNTPAVLHLELVEGEECTITVAPKGFGSENMSRLKMFTPAASREDIMDFVVECVTLAGSNPCPPVVVGVGIGGNFEQVALLAKKALCRSSDRSNTDEYYAQMEKELLCRINRTGVGPQGFGGDTTALAVNIEQYATHIAGLPVAVNMGCHVTRHAMASL